MATRNSPRIVEEKRKARAVAGRIHKGLIAYNAAKAGKPNYRKLGFRSFGRVRNYPRGGSRIFFVKSLA